MNLLLLDPDKLQQLCARHKIATVTRTVYLRRGVPPARLSPALSARSSALRSYLRQINCGREY
jgi:hypothetical protein